MWPRRVAITGIGAVTAIGIGRDPFWQSLLSGRSGISEIESFDTQQYDFHRAGEIKEFAAADFVRRQDPAQIGRAAHLAIAAGRLALDDAGLTRIDADPERVGVSLGTAYGEAQELERFDERQLRGEPDEGAAQMIWRYPCHRIAASVAREFDLAGPNLMIAGACAAGNYALAHAFDLVRTGRADVMLAGGATALSRVTFSGFARVGALAPDRCQPFDLNRKGTIPAEGSAALVLESLERPMRRGARIYAEIVGYGFACDAYNTMAPHPEGDGAARAMEKALRHSGLVPQAIGYISAHGTGTRASDRLETLAIKRVFGESAYSTPISSIKSMLGHTEGAASAIEAAACALVISEGIIPPTVGLETPDPECDLDYVSSSARCQQVEVAMNNAYGFGGYDASLILKACRA